MIYTLHFQYNQLGACIYHGGRFICNENPRRNHRQEYAKSTSQIYVAKTEKFRNTSPHNQAGTYPYISTVFLPLRQGPFQTMFRFVSVIYNSLYARLHSSFNFGTSESSCFAYADCGFLITSIAEPLSITFPFCII